MNSCQLLFLESGVFWWSQVLDLSLLPLPFSLILTVASRLLHPYSTNDKTSRLVVKRFSTVGDTQRGSQSTWKTRRRRGEIKRGESNLASNQFPICSPQSGTLIEVHGVPQRRGRKEIEVTRRRGGIQRGERNLAIKQFPICSPQSGTLREVHGVPRRKKMEDKGGNQKERDQSSL